MASPAQLIIAAMITPALLILGSGSLVATALVRLARAVDRSRALIQMSSEEIARLGMSRDEWRRSLSWYSERSMLAEKAVTAFFTAVGVFVIGCLSLAVDHFMHNSLTWLPVGLVITGMGLMLFGAYYMVLESRLASQQIRDEIQKAAERS